MESEDKDSLIIKYLAGDLNESEARELQLWIKQSQQNLKHFVEIRNIWDESGNEQEELQAALNRFRKNINPVRKPGMVSLPGWFVKVAAVLIMGIISYGLYRYLETGQVIEQIAEQPNNKIIIPKGQKGQLILSDGTRVWLNSESTLEYPGTFGAVREVILTGEAYFEVKSDEQHPFFVHTGNLNIKVTGTSFNIKAYDSDNEISTTLVNGRLTILKNDAEVITLKPKESAVYSVEKNQMVVRDMTEAAPVNQPVVQEPVARKQEVITPIELVTVWKDDKLIFQDEPLGNMVVKMERWFNRRIHISTELSSNRYNGKFVYNESIHQVLDIICRSSNLKYEEKEHEFYITKK